jgi:hypothetical protein
MHGLFRESGIVMIYRLHHAFAVGSVNRSVQDDWVIFGEQRWVNSRERRRELGLGHFEGRNWRGFHHHATLCIAAYGFLVAERNRFSPSARAGHLGFVATAPAPDFRPRGSPRTPRAA